MEINALFWFNKSKKKEKKMTTKKTSHVNENEVWPKMSLAAFRYISRRKQSPQREVFSSEFCNVLY